MESFCSLLLLILATASVSNYCASCDQLSTVFVLETSDSDSSPSIVSNSQESSIASKSLEDSNTRIITDDGGPINVSVITKSQKHQIVDSPVVVHHHQTTTSSPQHKVQYNSQHLPPSHNNNHETAHTNSSQSPIHLNNNIHSSNNIGNHDTENNKYPDQQPTSRRIEDESQLTAQRVATRNVNHQQTGTGNSQQRPRSTTTTTQNPYETREQTYSPVSTTTTTQIPKTEERLLISITSDDDDYKPPQKQLVSSGGIISSNLQNNDELQSPQHHHKRKPSITISIQDANLGKLNGGSGSSGASAVIVRPSENGQSIVISTVGASSLDQNNKYHQNSKPGAIAIVTSSSSNYNHNHNNQNEPPYREPAVIQNPGINHHHVSTTIRPQSLVSDYNPNVSPNRPITSTLIDQPRPPTHLSDERPSRPPIASDENNSGYENTRPSSKPQNVRPNEEPGGYNEQNEYSRPVNSNQQQQIESRYPLNEKNCGLVHETRIVGGDEADPDDFLWMAAIIKSKPKDGDVRPFCGGSLITRRHILTAAHCLENLAPRDVLVRLGSYDFDDSTASSLSADFAIDQFRVPAQYAKKTHVADIAIMRLKTPLSLTDNYKTVCMPQARRSYVGTLGTVTGYGSQSQTFRRAAPKLRQVTVPIWENRKCSGVYKKNLTESFLCAGYDEGGKDACQGDSGGPLMTEGPNERMMIVGVVSHGIGCGSPGYPGVYTRTTTYLEWIEKNTKE